MKLTIWKLLGVSDNSPASRKKLGVIALLYFIQGAPVAVLWEVLPVYFRITGALVSEGLLHSGFSFEEIVDLNADLGLAAESRAEMGIFNVVNGVCVAARRQRHVLRLSNKLWGFGEIEGDKFPHLGSI